MWFTILKKHFPGKRWRKYYKKIMFYLLSVNFGLKPSFMWDFGPTQVAADDLSCFILDLKDSALVSNEVVLVRVDDNIFISNVSNMLHSLEQNVFVMNVTNDETHWALSRTNEFVMKAAKQIKQNLKELPPSGLVTLNLTSSDCLTTVFGLLLGYPLIYYFKQNYQTLPLSLKLYRIKCKFKFAEMSEDFEIYSFSIPKNLVCPDVERTVKEWFDNLNNVDKTVHEELKLEHALEYVNSLNL